MHDRVMVLDVSFFSGCGVRRWDVQAVQEQETVTITPFTYWVPTGDRCATAHRYVQTFAFEAGDSARFIVVAELEGTPGAPAAVALDTIVPFHHVF